MKLNLVNPLVAYISIWLFTVFLVSLRLTTNLLPLNMSTVVLLFSNILTFIVIYAVFSVKFPAQKQHFDKSNILLQLDLLRKYTKVLLILWFAGTIVEIVVAGGVPLQWAFMHIEKNYTHFGINSFHGLMNSLYLFAITALFLDYIICGKRKILALCLVLLMWPIIMIGRGILLGAILQMLGVYLMVNDLRRRDILKIFILAICMLFLFGIMGDIRVSVSHPFVDLVADKYRGFFDNLPSGFLWFYVYVTSPLNNIIANIDNVSPNFIPVNSLFLFIPTAIRSLFCIDIKQLNALDLVDSNLNVSTFYAGFLADFGILGAIIIVAILQLIVTYFYLLGRRFKVWALLGYSVLFQCIVFSIFFNLFFYWTYIFQIILAFWFNRILKKANLN